jgi:hypothetical protein
LSTMSHLLEDARLKVARAEEHIRDLEREIGAYLETHPYEFVRRWQGEQRVTTLRVRVPPPHHLSVVVGDSLYNLRGSLELIFWALATQTGPKDSDRDRISFPIFANESKFRSAQDGLARYIPSEAIDVVEEVQPFRTRNAALSVLRTLSNQDKHGLLDLTVAGIPRTEATAVVVALNDPTMPLGGVETLLQTIRRHITTEVLPKFEPLLS